MGALGALERAMVVQMRNQAPSGCEAIREELAFLAKRAARSRWFSGLTLVGSWAAQDPKRRPDRRGRGTSDIDAMLHTVTRPWTHKAWMTADAIVQAFKDRFERPLELCISPVEPAGSPLFEPYVTLWGETHVSTWTAEQIAAYKDEEVKRHG